MISKSDEYCIEFLVEPTVQEVKRYKYFWYGFGLYTFPWVIAMDPRFSGFSTIFRVVELLGLIILVYNGSKLISFKINHAYLKFLTIVYILWVFVIIARGFYFDRSYITGLLLEPLFGVWMYFVPILVFFPKKLKLVSILFEVCGYFAIVYIVFALTHARDLFIPNSGSEMAQMYVEYCTLIVSLPAGYILMNYKYQVKKLKYFSVFALFLTFMSALLIARRGLLFLTSLIILLSLLGFIKNKGKLVYLVLFTYLLLMISSFFINYDKLFLKFEERKDEDTRSEVEYYFYRDFKYKDLDWVIGRGINGAYLDPSAPETGKNYYRPIIETGYLNMILKGGIIQLSLLILLIVPSAFLGIFSSNNFFSKAGGFWLLIWIVSLYPTILSNFTLNYLIVWLCVSTGYSKEIRNLTDEELIEAFSKSN